MKTLLIIAAVLLTSCAAQTGYKGQKNPNRKGSSKGHKCGRTLGNYVNSIKR